MRYYLGLYHARMHRKKIFNKIDILLVLKVDELDKIVVIHKKRLL